MVLVEEVVCVVELLEVVVSVCEVVVAVSVVEVVIVVAVSNGGSRSDSGAAEDDRRPVHRNIQG